MSQKGFTLVELAISITILGLLMVGTLGGVDMIKAGKLRKVVSEFTNYAESIDQFYAEYQHLPGDMPIIAQNYWAGAHYGNGDGKIDWSSSANREDLFTWEHLALAGLIPGTYTGVPNPVNNTDGYVSGTNTPTSDGAKGGVYIFGGPSSAQLFGANGIQIRLGAISGATNSPYSTGILDGKDSYSIDKKIDDGRPATGLLYSMNAADSGTACMSAASTVNTLAAATATYCLNSSTCTTKSCHLIYWYKKF